MKKIFILVMILMVLLVTGCGKDNSTDIFTDKVNKLNSYTLVVIWKLIMKIIPTIIVLL